MGIVAALTFVLGPSVIVWLVVERRWRWVVLALVLSAMVVTVFEYPESVRALLIVGIVVAWRTFSWAIDRRDTEELRARARAGEIRRSAFEIRIPGGTKDGMALRKVYEDIASICESTAKERRAGYGQVDVEFFTDFTRPGMERPEITVTFRCDPEDEERLREAVKLAYHDHVAIHPLPLDEDRSRELAKLLDAGVALEPEFGSAQH